MFRGDITTLQRWALAYVTKTINQEKAEFELEMKKAMIYAVDPKRYRAIFQVEEEESLPELTLEDFKSLDKLIDSMGTTREISAADITRFGTNEEVPWT